MQAILRDRFVGMARVGHPILRGKVTPKAFCRFGQISVSRRGRVHGPIDQALDALDLSRRVVLVVPSPQTALAALADSDLIVPVPDHVRRSAQALGVKVRAFDLPFSLKPVVIGQAWHPRFDKDAGHQFLRRTVREVCEAW